MNKSSAHAAMPVCLQVLEDFINAGLRFSRMAGETSAFEASHCTDPVRANNESVGPSVAEFSAVAAEQAAVTKALVGVLGIVRMVRVHAEAPPLAPNEFRTLANLLQEAGTFVAEMEETCAGSLADTCRDLSGRLLTEAKALDQRIGPTPAAK